MRIIIFSVHSARIAWSFSFPVMVNILYLLILFPLGLFPFGIVGVD